MNNQQQDRLIATYDIIRTSMNSESDRRSNLIYFYLTFISTLTMITIAGLTQLYTTKLVLIILVIPIANCFLSRIACKTATACYRKFLEHVVIAYKLEVLTGLVSIIPKGWRITEIKGVDKFYDVDLNALREAAAAMNGFEVDQEAQLFVENNLHKGTNRDAFWTFFATGIINVILSLAIIGLGLGFI